MSLTTETKTKPTLNVFKVFLAITTWMVLQIVGVLAIQGIGNIQNHYPDLYQDWQWQLWYLFFVPFFYPIFIYGLPLYISGIIPIIITRLNSNREVK